MRLSRSAQDYLQTIWKLGSRGERATPGAIAKERLVSAPSASIMVRRLQEAGWITRGPSAEVALSRAGEREALRVVRRQRLLETFLVQVCGLGWDEVEAEAEVLEYGLSARLEARIDEMLGHPIRDPHGDPIPDASGRHDEAWGVGLDAATEGDLFSVQRISDRDGAALRRLGTLGIVPGVVLEVGEQESFGGPRRARLVAGDEAPQQLSLGAQLSCLIFGRIERAKPNRPRHKPADATVVVGGAR